MEQNEVFYKVVVLGSSGVGKTAVCKRWIDNEFYENSQPTIGLSYFNKKATVANHEITISLWDTAGQEIYKGIAPLYTRSANAILIFASPENNESITNLPNWISIVKESSAEMPPIILAINKTDLGNKEKIDEIVNQNKADFDSVILCSAKTGDGIDLLFSEAAALAFENMSKKIPVDQKVNNTLDGNQSSGGCC